MPRAYSPGVVLNRPLAAVAGGKPTERVAGAGPAPPLLPPNVATTATPTATIDTIGSAARTAQRLRPAADSGGGSDGPSLAVSPAAGRGTTRARSHSHRDRAGSSRPGPAGQSPLGRPVLVRSPVLARSPVPAGSASRGRLGGWLAEPACGRPEPGNSNPGGPEPGGPAGGLIG